ncbi:hypothetical protein [Salinimicrobium sp. GXAS 041]|uniref:hypothetical protein n=1 Tax=Salinimicrobium sp. GXAS 041 TaxID=3400806 RepID=UPI003C76B501
MKEKKNIDRLYQEKFRDFEATPREAVWKSISAKLQEKEKPKVLPVPLWSRIAGVAAIISIIMLIGDWILQPQQNSVVTGEEQILEKDREIITSTEASIATINPDKKESSKSHFSNPNKASLANTNEKKTPVEETSSISPFGAKKILLSILKSEKSITSEENLEEKPLKNGIFEKKSILEALNEEASEEKMKVASFAGRLEVKTHAAPIYYGNFSKGNFLDSQFDNNSSEGEVTYSYGINIAYAISDKLKIRSGVNKVSLSYNTSGIEYHSVVNPFAVSSINYTNHDNLDNSTLAASPAGGKGEPLAALNKSSFGNLSKGMLNQRLGYLEVPVELEYKLINKKIELNVIGGASTMFLDENMISVNSGPLSTDLGEANNLNNISFSTNIGLGVDYNLNRKFKLNVEPMFKYQLNTFSSSSGGYQPYYLGVYSGFSYKF